MLFSSRDRSHYDRSQLREVICQIRFPAILSIGSQEPAERLLCIEDFRILLCHGHTYGVKQSLTAAGFAAEEKNLDLFLFGHTHRPLVDRRGKTLFLNPGSIGDWRRPTYGVVTIAGGKLDGSICLLE